MSKRLELKLTLDFSDDITEKEHKHIIENTMQALVNHVESSEEGLSGDNFEGYTTDIRLESDNFVDVWNVKTGM